ncbi:AI-2E family transporter [Rhizobium sp. L1K21]|uniref:AI-2E family transporter n=1 Tax=Rhizobium sp. L1K21 TaxID=2954933 RepID=UPI0020928A48|nr:AI-2E family transporter [Rhizobium sp. L1K21]MCO6186481.1 AI-2E family transporter [Rhizobium sp. L1K21]
MTTHISPSALRKQLLFWAAFLIFVVIFLTVFSSILLPFVAGMALAYFLDPVADWFETKGFSRLAATLTILVMFIIVFVLSMMIIIPLLISQASAFLDELPGYLSTLQTMITDTASSVHLPNWLADQMGSIKENFAGLLGEGTKFIGAFASKLWNSGKALVDVISLLVVTPVVAFYLLLDWDRMVARMDQLIPRDNVENVRQISKELNATIAGFVRGQGTLCLILGVYYGAALSLAGLNFGLLIGLFSGLISFIPYVGSTVGLILSVGVALVQFWPEYWWVLLIAGIFASGQFIEGNILQPKLVGESVGLHPVWLMFALFAFGLLFGFVGLLVAVPAAASVGVLVRHATQRYLDSDLYHGNSRPLKDTSEKADRPQ